MGLAQDLVSELTVARDERAPQIEGLGELAKVGMPAEDQTAILGASDELIRRRDLINAVLTAILALLADGYPELPAEVVTAKVLADLQHEQAVITAALAAFAGQPKATKLTLSWGPALPR